MGGPDGFVVAPGWVVALEVELFFELPHPASSNATRAAVAIAVAVAVNLFMLSPYWVF
jgi:hypothetical protein